MPYLLLVVTGVFAGLLGGLLGIGGSSIMLPAMVWILGAHDAAGTEQIHQYMAAAMIVNFLLILPSVVPHLRSRAVWAGVWKYLAAAGIVGIVVGVEISYLFQFGRATYLRWGVGAFFIYVIFHNVYRMAKGRRAEGLPRAQVEAMAAWRKLVVGFPMGVVAGLLGIGGGSLAVPGQQILLKMPLRNAIATSAATIATISWLGATVKNFQLPEHFGTPTRSLLLAACLAPTAMIGAYFGGRLTHTLPVKIVRIAFIAIMALAAYKMLQEPADAAVCWLLGLFAR